jgi:hypothetical protein
MNVRNFKETDFNEVVALLKKNNVEPPCEVEELNGPCFVAVDGGKLIGCIFALVGLSTKAYVDFLVVDKEFQSSMTLFHLLTALEYTLREIGVRRYVFNIELHNQNAIDMLFKYREKYQITKLRDLHYFAREL